MRHAAEVLTLLVASAALLSSVGCSSDKVTLVRDGKPAAVIVVAAQPTRSAQLAAAEIQEHVRRITGATLPIVSDAGPDAGKALMTMPLAWWPGQARILVGESRLTHDRGLRGTDFKPQEYLIHFGPGEVVLLGRDKPDTGNPESGKLDYAHGEGLPDVFDDQATCYAAYDFLERYCGVRWLAPGELGLVCPQSKTLEVGGPDVRRAPFFPYRHGPYIPMYGFIQQIWGNPSRADLNLFWRRQRLGGQAYTANHSFYGYYERFWKKDAAAPDPPEGYHPEFFAQGYDAQPPQMCYTNEAFIQQVIRDARDYFDGKAKHPGAQAAGDFFALVPMDNDFWCKCPKCQALLNPPGANADFANDQASDYFFQFANRVAREVGKTHPGKYLACLAYSSYTGHPRRVKLEPNISIQFCMTVRNWWAPATERTDLGLFRDWVAKEPGRPFYVWLYYCFPEETATNNKFYCFPGFFSHTIARQFRMFASDGVKGFFLNNLGEYLDTYATFRLADDPYQDIDALIDEFHRLYYGPAAGPMKHLYLGIENTYMNPGNYPPAIAQGRIGGQQSAEIAWKYLGTAERMGIAGQFMAEAKALATAEPYRKRVALFEETFWNYMVAGRRQYKQRAAAPIPSLRAPRVAGAGGDVARVAWDKAAPLGGGTWFDRGADKPSARKFAGRIAHDERYLYLELTDFCDPKKLTTAGKVFPCDDWEVFVAGQRGLPYRQYAVGPTGQIVAMSDGEVNWRMNVEIPDHGLRVASDTAADRWTVRMAIPLKTAIPGGVAGGGKVFLNVVRVSSPAIRGGDGLGLDTLVSFCSVHDVDRLAEVTLEP